MKQVIRKSIIEANNIKTEENIYTLVVDGSSVLKTALVSTKLNQDGLDYGAIINFFNMIRQVIVKRDFSKCYVFFDDDLSGQLRADIYPAYKANRDKHYNINETEYDKKINDYVKKVLAYSRNKKKESKKGQYVETEDERYSRCRDIIIEICEELYIRAYMAKYVEADDLCAYVVRHKKPNEKIVIISSDRDLAQLIADDVCLYVLNKKTYVIPSNCVEVLGCTHENIVLKKIFCGDASDNIAGIKGVGEKTFFSLFPEAVNNKMLVEDVISRAKEINDERKNEKKRPLKACENIINNVTDGVQGNKIYEINKKIISLEEPLLTEEATETMKMLTECPLDDEGRDFKNLYKIAQENKINDLLDDGRLGDFFGAFNGLIYREKHNK